MVNYSYADIFIPNALSRLLGHKHIRNPRLWDWDFFIGTIRYSSMISVSYLYHATVGACYFVAFRSHYMGSLWYFLVTILPCCSPFVFHSFHKQSWTLSSSTNADPSESFGAFDRLLFNRFSDSVYNELSTPVNSTRSNKYTKAADNYRDLIEMINYMTHSRPIKQVNKQGTNMLVKLFPPGLLPTYKLTFAKFPNFSAWMNTWVTYYTTQWLMGKSKVEDLVINNDGV